MAGDGGGVGKESVMQNLAGPADDGQRMAGGRVAAGRSGCGPRSGEPATARVARSHTKVKQRK